MAFTRAQRVAVGELCHAAALMTRPDGTPHSETHAALGAVFLERAANIVRGDSAPIEYTDADVLAFAEFWDVSERAAFNPQEGPTDGEEEEPGGGD